MLTDLIMFSHIHIERAVAVSKNLFEPLSVTLKFIKAVLCSNT